MQYSCTDQCRIPMEADLKSCLRSPVENSNGRALESSLDYMKKVNASMSLPPYMSIKVRTGFSFIQTLYALFVVTAVSRRTRSRRRSASCARPRGAAPSPRRARPRRCTRGYTTSLTREYSTTSTFLLRGKTLITSSHGDIV